MESLEIRLESALALPERPPRRSTHRAAGCDLRVVVLFADWPMTRSSPGFMLPLNIAVNVKSVTPSPT